MPFDFESFVWLNTWFILDVVTQINLACNAKYDMNIGWQGLLLGEIAVSFNNTKTQRRARKGTGAEEVKFMSGLVKKPVLMRYWESPFWMVVT
jgi:hypothetical protein